MDRKRASRRKNGYSIEIREISTDSTHASLRGPYYARALHHPRIAAPTPPPASSGQRTPGHHHHLHRFHHIHHHTRKMEGSALHLENRTQVIVWYRSSVFSFNCRFLSSLFVLFPHVAFRCSPEPSLSLSFFSAREPKADVFSSLFRSI
ncbi:uncharacterized protein ACA1_253730 [Acanthamoeba castellanii str. Neff]|uniref:Uncharacterized protein n=1 Tax=Acanthamoeba castellanii (strain ATCC 30010 / Neff) TaxID=1257118 RepID=L8HDA3_ACACF|nr:uncharacterized protein ACA1_253730 [Acanthamoeba castellanii str. Neff]ELR22376.1 hypothetical protein ACA1_253730 [Acanthamoeba castellanii str. Neff]